MKIRPTAIPWRLAKHCFIATNARKVFDLAMLHANPAKIR
jgi:hypothetical protein